MRSNTNRPGRRRLTREAIRLGVAERYPKLAARHRKPVRTTIDPSAIALGRNDKGYAVLIGDRLRLEHCFVLGASGGGKSNLIEHVCWQTIENGCGLVLIDPHGHSASSPFRHLLARLHGSAILSTRALHIIDANDPSHTVGIQPLMRPNTDTDVSVIAANCFEAVERIFSAGDTSGKGAIVTPTIRRLLTALFAAAAELGLTLAEVLLLIDPHDSSGLRRMAVERLHDRYAKAILADLHQMSLDDKSKRDFRAEAVGPLNRLSEFLRSPAMRCILGQTDPSKVLDFGKVLAGNEVVLMNAGGGDRMASGDAEVLARLVLRSLFFAIERRKAPFVPFYIVIDEAHRVLSGDVERMLAEVRKRGVGMVLAMQSLSQAGKPDDPMREAILSNTNVKLAFRLRNAREAAEVAEAMIPLDVERPVEALIKPTVVGHKRTLFRTAGRGRNHSTNWSKGVTETDSVSETETESFAETVGESATTSVSDTAGVSSGSSRAVSDGVSDGQSGASSSGWSAGSTLSSGSSSSQGASRSISVEAPASSKVGPTSGSVGTRSSGGDEGTATMSEGRDASQGSNRGIAESSARTEANSAGWSSGTSRGRSSSESDGNSQSRTVGKAVTRSVATTVGNSYSRTVGYSIAHSSTHGESDGTSTSEGITEGLEPILELLPSAVHGLENMRYLAAQRLLGLPTGQAFLNCVTPNGMLSAYVFVPEVKSRTLSESEFADLRRCAMALSPSAITIEEVERNVAEHEAALLAEAGAVEPVDEPESFRVPISKSGSRKRQPKA